MKTKMLVLILTCFLAGGFQSLFAQHSGHDKSRHKMNMNQQAQPAKATQETVDSVKVMGNCGQCKKRIETAAMSVKGVKSASWNDETEMLHLVFTGESKTVEVQKAVAKAGHDTETIKADDNVYNALPGCCKYRK